VLSQLLGELMQPGPFSLGLERGKRLTINACGATVCTASPEGFFENV
jgi:hypothetical protein